MNSRQKQAKETEYKIVHSALELIRKTGYENVGVRDICREAGISTGAFYHHFRSKEDMIDLSVGSFDDYLEEVLSTYENADPCAFLRFVLLSAAEYVMNKTGSLTKELYRAVLSTNDKFIIGPSRLYYRTVRQKVSLCLQDGIFNAEFSEDYLMELLIRVVRGNIIDWCLYEYAYDLTERTGRDLDVVFTGLKAK